MTDSLLPGQRRTTAGRLAVAGSVAAVAVAVIGFFTGVNRTNEAARLHAVGAPTSPAPVASGAMPSYRTIGATRRGPNADMYDGAVAALALGLPGLFDPVRQAAGDREQAIARRAERRAYDGAPPTIPHAVDAQGVPACLACHQLGAVIAGKRAPVMSHERHDSCLQCHVPSADARGLGPSSNAPESAFVGLAAVREGVRAWAGAPPTIPHPTHMREQCNTCHGVGGAVGLRTPHPYRESCTQCHAPNATLDQRREGTPPAPKGRP